MYHTIVDAIIGCPGQDLDVAETHFIFSSAYKYFFEKDVVFVFFISNEFLLVFDKYLNIDDNRNLMIFTHCR